MHVWKEINPYKWSWFTGKKNQGSLKWVITEIRRRMHVCLKGNGGHSKKTEISRVYYK